MQGGNINEQQWKQKECRNKGCCLVHHRSYASDICLHIHYRTHVPVPEIKYSVYESEQLLVADLIEAFLVEFPHVVDLL